MLDPAFFTALVSSRICHDMVSPISSVASALELMDDENTDESMHKMAEDLLRDGSRKLQAYILFLRYAFGSMGMSDSIADIHAAKDIVNNFAELQSPSVEWDVETAHFSYFHTRLLMQMVYIGITSLPRGGVVTIRVKDHDGLPSIVIEARGERAMLRPEAEAAIAKTTPEGGWNGRNIHMMFAVQVAEQLGSRIIANRVGPDDVIYTAQNLLLEAQVNREGLS